MPRGSHPILLILALALPVSVDALGLGDIHVDSALNEPLSAQIDIVGASLDDLTDLRAAIASLETFQRYGAERPTFLNSATFKMGRDAQGRPVLNVRSRDPFTDPLVSLLVDLKWRHSELVREYALLLDPAGFSIPQRAARSATASASESAAAPVATAAVVSKSSVEPRTEAAVAVTAPAGSATVQAFDFATHHRITSHDTLRGIVRRAGARSESQIQRSMMATFRANPTAFEGNINRLHRGVVVNLPTNAEIDAVSVADAKRDVDAQMTAWRTRGRFTIARQTPAPGQTPSQVQPASQVQPPAQARTLPQVQAASADADRERTDAALASRLQSLEQQLGDLHRQMAEAAPREPAAASDTTHMNRNALLGLTALLLAAALASYGYFRKQLQRPIPRNAKSAADVAAGESSAAAEAAAEALAASQVPVEPGAAPIGLAAEANAVPQANSPRRTPAHAQAPDMPRAAPTPAPALRPGAVAAQWPPRSAGDTTTGMAVEVDAEALERSYLESLGFNTSTFGKDTAGTGEFQFAKETRASTTATLPTPTVALTVAALATTTELEMSEVEEMELDETEVNTAVIKVDATTLVVSATSGVAATTTPVDTAASVTTELDFNLSDLDATSQHVQMPSALNEHVEVSESRTNIVDVLKMAIDRDPHRRDLRMKLVETYYNAALGNRRAFMEVVRKLAREREYLSADEWNKVVRMGREIAPEDTLFADLIKDADDVAA